jgi:putative intracellular protease/amidase
VLRGRNATVWDDGKGTEIDLLERCGATFVDTKVVVDDRIVTANGPEAAVEFGKVFATLELL